MAVREYKGKIAIRNERAEREKKTSRVRFQGDGIRLCCALPERKGSHPWRAGRSFKI